MFNAIGKILLWLRDGGLKLLVFALLLLLLWGTFALVGTIVWWLDRGEDKLERKARQLSKQMNSDRANPQASATQNRCYIVFLTRVGDMSADQLASGEEVFLDRLEQDQPHCVTVRNVFPYSAANQDVGGQGIFKFLWNVVDQAEGWLELTKYLLQFRNVWRMAISADDRYRSIYNQAITLTIVEQMEKQQPIPTSPEQPIQLILMGTSGGAQVALGAAPYLHKWLPVEISVVSFGGVFDGNEGFDVPKHVYQFRGQRDWIENIGGIVFPSQWRWTIDSPYNRARREGRYTVYSSAPHEHEGDEGYFGQEVAKEDGKTYVVLMLERLNQFPIWSKQTLSLE